MAKPGVAAMVRFGWTHTKSFTTEQVTLQLNNVSICSLYGSTDSWKFSCNGTGLSQQFKNVNEAARSLLLVLGLDGYVDDLIKDLLSLNVVDINKPKDRLPPPASRVGKSKTQSAGKQTRSNKHGKR